MDTWPRWEVFKQDAPGKPHQSVGSVHAPDPETALLAARNVFVRRPQAASLWVIPAEAILTFPGDELPDGPPGCYLIFSKTSQRRSMTFVEYRGCLEAPSPRQALKEAEQRWGTAWVWWLAPKERCVESPEGVQESWFDPALEKTYKQQQRYGLIRPKRMP
jgi:ring-1,2-phenylacetyl-CoA epoxidase subunit PaaB